MNTAKPSSQTKKETIETITSDDHQHGQAEPDSKLHFARRRSVAEVKSGCLRIKLRLDGEPVSGIEKTA